MNFNLALPFYESSTKNPQALALFVGGTRFSYEDLAYLARRVAGWLSQTTGEGSGGSEFLHLGAWKHMQES